MKFGDRDCPTNNICLADSIVPDNTSKNLEESVANSIGQQSLAQMDLNSENVSKNSTNNSQDDIHSQTSELDISANICLDFDAPLSYEESEIRIIKLCSIIAAIQIFVILAHLISICILTKEHKPQLIPPLTNQNIYGNYTE